MSEPLTRKASHSLYEYVHGHLMPEVARVLRAVGYEGVKTGADAYLVMKTHLGYKSLKGAPHEELDGFKEQCHAFAAELGYPIFDRSTPDFLKPQQTEAQ